MPGVSAFFSPAAAEVDDGAREAAGEEHVAGGIDGEGADHVVVGSAEGVEPDDRTAAVEPCHEDIAASLREHGRGSGDGSSLPAPPNARIHEGFSVESRSAT